MAMIYAGFGAVDPATLYADLTARGVPTDRWWGKAGTFRTGPGAKPGRGWLLLRKDHLDAIDATADHDLAFSGEDPNHVVTLSPITLLHSECVNPGSASDSAATFLCEVVDRRFLLGRIPLDKAYNVTLADGTDNYTQTKNAGSNWTWQEIVTDIVTVLGINAITLPFTPDAAPNNLMYWGHPSALECLCDVLKRMGCDLAYDPVADTFSAVRLGVAQDASLDAADASSKGRTWDGYPSETNRGKIPKYVRVRFMRRPVDTADGYSPYWFEDVTLDAVSGQEDGTFVQIDDDLPALGASGTPSNSAALTTRATERAADWLRKRRYYDRPVLRAWRDFLPDAAGLGAVAVRDVIFDDRAAFTTWVKSGQGWEMEDWRPNGGWPVWWPLDTAGDIPHDEAALASDYAITGNDGLINQDTGLEIVLPDAGTYLVYWHVAATMVLSSLGTPAGANARIYAALHDVTASVTVPNTTVSVCHLSAWDTGIQASDFRAVSGSTIYTVNEPTTIQLWAGRIAFGTGATFTTSSIVSTDQVPPGNTYIGYTRLTNVPGGAGPTGPTGATGATGATGPAGAPGGTFAGTSPDVFGFITAYG